MVLPQFPVHLVLQWTYTFTMPTETMSSCHGSLPIRQQRVQSWDTLWTSMATFIPLFFCFIIIQVVFFFYTFTYSEVRSALKTGLNATISPLRSVNIQWPACLKDIRTASGSEPSTLKESANLPACLSPSLHWTRLNLRGCTVSGTGNAKINVTWEI